MSFHRALFIFSPLIIFPYIITALIVSSYYIYLKYRLRREIKHLPFSQTVGVELRTVMSRLCLKSTIYNFILFLSLLEIISNILLETSLIAKYSYNLTDTNPVHISNSCTLRDPVLTGISEVSTFLVYFTFSFTINVWTLFPVIMSILYMVLGRLFINYPYWKHIRKYIIYIFIQLLVKTTLFSFVQTLYFSQLLYTPFGVLDTCIYISASRKFYNLLKGNRNAASLHSSRYRYLQTQRMVKHFFYAQIFTLTTFFTLLFPAIIESVLVPISILAYNPCFLNYVSFGIIPDISIVKHIQDVFIYLVFVLQAIQMVCLFIVELFFIALYFSLFLKLSLLFIIY